ncbi:MAG: hypothetical protein IJK58_01960 [Clostridia bacterium]|nr:hypothetical protein [Clostridia bacterium]
MTEKNEARVVRRGDRKTEPMPESREAFILNRSFSEEEMNALRLGHIPQAMEDKWFWYTEGQTLFAHRSWTGYCIYRIDFKENNKHVVTVNADPEQYGISDTVKETETLNKLLDCWVRTPYDHYGQWLSETYDALNRSDKD